MGGRKARLIVDGRALVMTHVIRMREAGARPVVAVLRPEDERLVEGHARVALSTEADSAGSLARGVERLDPGDDLIVITPVDALPASVETIRRLARAVAEGAAAAVPTIAGKGGHPIVVRASVLRGATGRPLRDVLAALGANRARLEVDDVAVLTDLDAPSDLGALGPARFV